MPRLFLLLFFLLGAAPRRHEAPQLQAILTQVANAPGLAPFLMHYRSGPIYFRISPASRYPAPDGQTLRQLTLRLLPDQRLLYSETHDEKRYPVLSFRIVALQPTTAEVWVGLHVQGAVGQFTLRKDPEWRISSADVYEI